MYSVESLCRAYGALLCFFLLTHGDAVGYPVVAPGGARAFTIIRYIDEACKACSNPLAQHNLLNADC